MQFFSKKACNFLKECYNITIDHVNRANRNNVVFHRKEVKMKRFVNTSGRELVIYSDSKLTTKIGMLYRDSACHCILEHDGTVVVLYKVSSNGIFKVGFTDYSMGVQDA